MCTVLSSRLVVGSSGGLSRQQKGLLACSFCFLFQGNTHLMRKIPAGAEASNILVGEVDFLEKCLCVLIRLKEAVPLGDLAEVPVPTRFIFLLLGPSVSKQPPFTITITITNRRTTQRLITIIINSSFSYLSVCVCLQ